MAASEAHLEHAGDLQQLLEDRAPAGVSEGAWTMAMASTSSPLTRIDSLTNQARP